MPDIIQRVEQARAKSKLEEDVKHEQRSIREIKRDKNNLQRND